MSNKQSNLYVSNTDNPNLHIGLVVPIGTIVVSVRGLSQSTSASHCLLICSYTAGEPEPENCISRSITAASLDGDKNLKMF